MMHPFAPSTTGQEGLAAAAALFLLVTLIGGSAIGAGLLIVSMGAGVVMMVFAGRTEEDAENYT